ncbi:MAG: F-type H+-transporting ATPase subunit b [Acidobacteriota bacterium]|jgi:F-type H+-transporting ATPase subunit b|nr:F-type H+-transporting ATPase subunit b [Acidobacteriota bacterium]
MISLAFAENSIQLVPDGTLFLHIAIILVMVFVLNATLFKPINRILEEREKRTRGRSGEANDILRSVEEKLAHYEQTLRKTRAEGYRLMEQERSLAMNERQAKLSAVREEINRSVADQKETIHAQAEEARATLDHEARRLAAEIGGQILHRPISDTVTRSLGLSA